MMPWTDALVYMHRKIAGLDAVLDLPAGQLVGDEDMISDAQRARVRMLVTGGPTPLSRELVERFPNLGLIVSVAAGYDGIDVEHARSLGIKIGTGIGVNAADVADLAVGSLIALVRDIVGGDRLIRDGGWHPRRVEPTRSIGALNAGIVGLGTIGQAIAQRMTAFGCRIEWFGRRPKATPWVRVDSLVELAERSDVLFVATHLSAETTGMIDAAAISTLGPEGYLVNVGRGPLVDEDALIAALREGRLGGAALDVFATEPTPPEKWRDVPNTVLTPHLGGVTHEALAGVFLRARDNVRRGLAGEEPLGRVA